MRGKSNRILACIYLLTIFLLAGCASTKIEGVQKENVNLYEYNNVLISFESDNLQYKKNLETAISKKLSHKNIVSLKSSELFSPLKNYTDTEKSEIIKANKIGIVLEIKLISTFVNNGGSSTVLMPIGGVLFGSSSNNVNLTMDFDISIFDMTDGELIFKGTASSTSEDYNFSDCVGNIFESLASKIVSQYFSAPNQEENEQ